MAIPELTDTSGRLTDCIYFGDPISANIGSGFVPTARSISTTLPLTGGGDFSANRTFAINNFAGSVAGAVPPSLGGVVTFLRADGSWATPPTFGAAAAGYAPASGGGAVNYLRADGTWAPPAGTGIAGLTQGFYPVADSATSIIDGLIFNTGSGHIFCSEYTSGTDYLALSAIRGASYWVVSPVDVDGATPFVTPLRIAGQASAAYVEAAQESITVAGAFRFPEDSLALTNGLNSNIALSSPRTSMWVRATGPTAAFSIGGIQKTVSAAPDSELLYIYNTTAQAMTIVHESASSTAANRIITSTGANIVIPGGGRSVAVFVYSDTDSRWLLAASNPVAQYPRTSGYIPYENASGNLADCPELFYDAANGFIGLGTNAPRMDVDIAGVMGVRPEVLGLSAGLNSDIPMPKTSLARIVHSGFPADFSVGGIEPEATAFTATYLTLENSTSTVMTIVNEDLSSTDSYRILTGTGADLVLPQGSGCVDLVYDTTSQRWRVRSTSAMIPGGADTQIQWNYGGVLSGDTGFTASGTGTAKTVTLGTDVVLARKAARHLQLGASGPSPAAYTITGQSSIGGTDSNKRGGKFSVGGGAGTGAGGGGDTALVTAYPVSLGNTQNPLVDRLIYGSRPVALTDSSATTAGLVAVATEQAAGGTYWATIHATDGTDMQIRRMRVEWGAVNKAGTITVALGTPEEVDCTPVGTLTATISTVDNGDDTFEFEITPISSLTTTLFEAWVSIQHDGRGFVVMA